MAPRTHPAPRRQRLARLIAELSRAPAVSSHRALTVVTRLFFGGGGLLVLATTFLPAASGARSTALVRMLDVSCIVLAIMLTRSDRRLSVPAHNAIIAFGASTIAVAVAGSGGGSTAAAYAVMLLLPVVYAFFALSPLIATAHLAFTMTIGSVALATVPRVGVGEQMLLWGTLTFLCFVVGWLVRAADEVEVDALTRLANRRGADRLLDAATGEASGGSPVVVLADLDHFKAFNEAESRSAGDQVLVEVARAWSPLLPAGGLLARYSGDEFLAVLPGASREAAAAFAEALRSTVPGGLTCSIGLATWEQGESRSMLMARADVALYSAKRAGRGRIQHHHGAGAGAREVRDGLRRAEFEVHFQPIVDLVDGRLSGAEALVRWSHPERGLLPPGDFLAEAEHDGTIVAMGSWVLHEACRRAAEWPQVDGVELSLSVNASGRELQDPLYADHVQVALRTSGLAAERLTVELVESEYDIESLYVANNLHRLSVMGVRTAIDDFGTGYSSMDRLRRLGVDALKIDQSFVADIVSVDCKVPLVEAVLAMARALDLQVVAEGVETEVQERWLREHGCQKGQGYLFGRAEACFPAEAPRLFRRAVAPRL